jgi:SAM-dependent methyltransferase
MNLVSSFEERYFSGRELYGDDFSQTQIAEWFADEEHGYAELYGADPQRHEYGYTALNTVHGFSCLPRSMRFSHALGFGSNFGDELVPLLARIERVTLLDASDKYVVTSLRGVPVSYVLAQPSGAIALASESVDLITCFGVLHHIPNVSRVLSELARVLTPGGTLLVREPTTTMGDWRRPRKGLTRRERGIPQQIFVSMLERSGLEVIHASPCYFPPWVRLCQRGGVQPFGSVTATRIDGLLSRVSAWNAKYHRPGLLAKFAPASLFVTARKR